jgi:hypothetical protein
MNEVYRTIPGHLHYEVSDHGNVRSLTHQRTLRGKGGSVYTRTHLGKVLQLSNHSGGYKQVTFSPGGTQLVHALVMLAFAGPPPADQSWINHKDGDKTNNHLSNLEYGTAKWNREHAVHTGLHDGPPGAGKLTTDQVIAINELLKAGGLTQQAIGDRFGVNQRMVSSIKRGKSWQWLTGNGA